ncbi:MAG: SAM-dependent methyltransferase [Hyphomonadaceae bacterium BRH_c29]|nr:MAG: SAM-dependent methyltransferase [Hyphomonadaceae bacterium BRH_c29]
MSETPPANAEQAEQWNGPGARSWIQAQTLLDQTFLNFEKMLVEAVKAAGASTVLDIGCGTGATTRAIARQLGPDGRALGLDISAPMIARATELAKTEGSAALFAAGDAQTQAFEPGSFDMITSRFGVMFFSDPVAAFSNLRGALRPDGQLAMVSWRSAAENPFMTVAERAAAPLLPDLPPRRSGSTGQFAFADQTRIQGILDDSGWRGGRNEAIDVTCTFPADALDTYLSLMGPVGQMLAQQDDDLKRRVVDAIRTSFETYLVGSNIAFTAACWMTRATA